jgi:DNA-binding NarL/FixJ family response regulator
MQRVLLADVAGAGRRAVATVLHSLPGVAVVAEVATAAEIARELRRSAPDVLVIDDRVVGFLGPRDAELPIVVMGLDDDPSFALRAERLGATWIAKELADELLPDALARIQRDSGA